MEKLKKILFTPLSFLEDTKKEGNQKKLLIAFAILIGISIVTGLIATMYGNSTWSGEFNGDALGDINYISYIFKSLLSEIFLIGGALVGVFAVLYKENKKTTITNLLSLILIPFIAYYLINGACNIIFMFKFIYTINFFSTINHIIQGIVYLNVIILLIGGIRNELSAEYNDKFVINLLVLFTIFVAIGSFGSLIANSLF